MPPALDPQHIRAKLDSAFPDSVITLRDDGHLHVGHAGAREGGHYSVRIVSPRFIDLSRVARHRLVYDALSEGFRQGIHALAIEALSPAEAEERPPSA